KNGVNRRIVHPSRTLLQKPWYTRYVRHVRETASVGAFDPSLLSDCRTALRMCTNIKSFTWMDDGHDDRHDTELIAYLDILQELRVQELIIRTSSGINAVVWDRLTEIDGLCKVAIWCLNGQPRVLQGWSEKLGSSLTHLELGVSCLSRQHPHFLSQLPLLKALRLKGAPSSSIPELLAVLPNLVVLDTEYFGTGNTRFNEEPVASLRELTVRTSSVDILGPQMLWPWIQKLIPRPSLETLTLNTFSTSGDMTMPRRFLLDLAGTHRLTLKHFIIDTVQLTMEELELLCTAFPALESISCSIAWCDNPDHLGDVIADAHRLRRLKLQVNWLRGPGWVPFGSEHARKWMLRDNSRLRDVTIGRDMFEVNTVIGIMYLRLMVSKPRANGCASRQKMGDITWNLKSFVIKLSIHGYEEQKLYALDGSQYYAILLLRYKSLHSKPS
ncbi:hypothetical protein PHLCEN_2v10796, partial [Hermanssonia centrifuga]